MISQRFWASVGVCVGSLGCGGGGGGGTADEVEDTFTIHVERTIAEQRIPGSPVAEPIALMITGAEVDIREELAEHDISDIQEVRLEMLTLRITPTAMPVGDTDDFDFVDTVDVYVVGREGSTLPRLHVASRQGVADGLTVLEIPPTAAHDLQPYVDDGGHIEIHGTGRPPPDDVTFDGLVEIAVELI